MERLVALLALLALLVCWVVKVLKGFGMEVEAFMGDFYERFFVEVYPISQLYLFVILRFLIPFLRPWIC